jgi:hypothetical protein
MVKRGDRREKYFCENDLDVDDVDRYCIRIQNPAFEIGPGINQSTQDR